MMKRILSLAAAVLVVAATAGAQGAIGSKHTTLVATFDLDGAAANTAAIVAQANISDSMTATIAAQPDVPRPLVVTVTDADTSITVGTYTVVGTASDGAALSQTVTISGNLVTTLTGNWAVVTSVTTSVLTGETAGTDKIQVGTTATIPVQYVTSFGKDVLDSQGKRSRDPYAWRTNPQVLKVTTSGSSTTISSYTASSSALANVNIGDILGFNLSGDMLERAVVTNADDNTVTVSRAITLPTAGTTFFWKRLYYGPEDEDGWFSVDNTRVLSVTFAIAQLNGTGGINRVLQCQQRGAGWVINELMNSNTATVGVTTYDYTMYAFDRCRVGLQWGTNDDGTDTTTLQEQITVQIAQSY